MQLRLTRRQVALSLMTIAGPAAAIAWQWRIDEEPFELSLPPAGDPEAPTLEVYAALARIVLLRKALDEAIVQRTYSLFMDEPWGPKHIGTAYAALRAALVQQKDRAHVRTSAVLEDGERWFITHLLTTWYLGIYYHEQRPIRRVTHEGALMHNAVRGLIPVPFVEKVGYGGWAKKPSAGPEKNN